MGHVFRRSGLLVLAILAVTPGPAQAAGFLAGASKVDITPPAYNAADDATDFSDPVTGTPLCAGQAFDGPRPFRFMEPYRDLDGNGRFDYPEPFCDANANGRWEGLYESSHVNTILAGVHDAIDVRAVAISAGAGKTLVVASVMSQGLFENYIGEMRAKLAARLPTGTPELIVSANHNESSPDTVGIYGAPDVGGLTGARSGIDEYYVAWLEDRVVDAAVAAVADLRPASLRALKARAAHLQRSDLQPSYFPLVNGLRIHMSRQFPQVDDTGFVVAVDTKLGVLQAVGGDGRPIFTVLNLPAHNQRIGHDTDGTLISGDWPGYFHRRLESKLPGMAMFLVGTNGSQEDPEPDPAPKDSYDLASEIGTRLGDWVAEHAADGRELRDGAITFTRKEFFAPLENNAFRGLALAGIFGKRPLYTGGVATGPAGTDLRSYVSVASIGPDLQLMGHPAETFPALAIGSPWTKADAECPNRPEAPASTWHARADFRFSIGLADDLIGYVGPSWAYTGDPGVYVDPMCPQPSGGHNHPLETEGAGYTAGDRLAGGLTELLDATPDPTAHIRRGRYIQADGTLVTRPDADTVAAWLAAEGATALTPGKGTIVALPGVGAFGSQRVDATGVAMDYDGASELLPDLDTRGMLVRDACDGLAARWYVDVYDVAAPKSVPAAASEGEPDPPACPPAGSGTESPGSGTDAPGGTSATRGTGSDGSDGGTPGRPAAVAGPSRRCFPRLLRSSGRALGPAVLGHDVRQALKATGLPRRTSATVTRWCVNGRAGRVVAVAGADRRVRLLITSGPSHAYRGVHPAMRLSDLLRRLPQARRTGAHEYRLGRGVYADIRARRVRWLVLTRLGGPQRRAAIRRGVAL